MKRSHGSLLMLAMVLVFSGGCSIKNLSKRIQKESDKQTDLVCECLSGPEQVLCYETGSYFDWTDDCYQDAFKEDKSASRESLNCLLDEMKDVTKCLEDHLDCDDYTSSDQCYNESDCKDLPSSVQEALSQCG